MFLWEYFSNLYGESPAISAPPLDALFLFPQYVTFEDPMISGGLLHKSCYWHVITCGYFISVAFTMFAFLK